MINGIFGGDAEFREAYANIQNFIRSFYIQAGANVKYNIPHHCATVGFVMAQTSADLSHLPQPSIFKKSAQFTLNFVIHNPISTDLPDNWYPAEIPRRNFHNALLAFEICRNSLFNAVIYRDDNDGRGIVEKPLKIMIKPSQHQMGDITKCLAMIQRAEEGYDTYARLLALMYESLAYEFNPDCRYPEPK